MTIDRYNRIALAHFQMLLWTLLVLASYLAAMLTNLMAGSSGINALNVSIPPELWAAMGISAGSFTASKVIALKIPDSEIAENTAPGNAGWVDMFNSTGSLSHKAACTHLRTPTWSANSRKARAAVKRSAASKDNSPAPSTQHSKTSRY
jgi:hypothetical protein